MQIWSLQLLSWLIWSKIGSKLLEVITPLNACIISTFNFPSEIRFKKIPYKHY
jgi:hypothetical protein